MNNMNVRSKGYGEAGASWKRKATKGFTSESGSAHEDIDLNNKTLRHRGRMLYMGAPVATSAIKTNRTNVVGVGLKLKARIDREYLGLSKEQADSWESQCEREFALWADKKTTCDAIGMNNFYELQQLAITSELMSGDAFVLLKHLEPTALVPYGLRIQLIEADRISTPDSKTNVYSALTAMGQAKNGNKIFDGVEVDKNGLVQAYYICNKYPGEMSADELKWERVKVSGDKTNLPNILQIFESERPEQYRGVTYLAQIIEPILQVRRYTDAEIVAAIIESCFTGFVTTENADVNSWNETNEEDRISDNPNDYEMGPGQVNFLKPGEDITFADPKRPGGGFSGFVRALCEQIGAALEIPVDMLMKTFSTSYNASRAALMEAWKAFRMRRAWFIADFCEPIYEVWMAEAVARGRLSAPGFFTDPSVRAAYLKADWVGPTQGQLDPVKEVNAETLAVAQGFSTREQSTIKLNGGSWESNIDKLARENRKFAEAQKNLSEREETK